MKPILFDTDMVCAILEGRKTVTRRVVKPQPRAIYYDGKVYNDDGLYVVSENQNGGVEQIELPYRPGNILYVRETWNRVKKPSDSEWHYEYKASCADPNYFSDGFAAVWRPSIHMPREAARIFLQVKDVRVERLQDITDDGIVRDFDFCAEALKIMNTQQKDVACMALWDSTIKPSDRTIYGWEANPLVWVIEFEKILKPV